MAVASKYPARAVNVADEEDAHPGSVAVTDEALIFSSPGLTLRMTYEELLLNFTNKRNSAIDFQHPDHSDWRVTAYEHRILRERVFKDHDHLRQQIADIRSRQQGVGQVIITIFFVAFLIGLGYVAGYAVERSVPHVSNTLPTTRDGEIGAAIRPLVEERFTLGAYPEVTAQLNDHLRRLVPAEERERFQLAAHILDTPDLISFSLPGGDIFVSVGILRLIPEAELVAGVLAHEIGHVVQRHAIRLAVYRKGSSMVLRGLLGDEPGITAAVASAGPQLIAPTYPREFDLEADAVAWTLLTKARINPDGLTRSLSALADRQYSEYKEERPHPSILPNKERWTALEQKAAAMAEEIEFTALPPAVVPPAPAAPPEPIDF